MTDDPYAPPGFGSNPLPTGRKPPSRLAIAGSCVAVVALGVVLGWSVGWALGSAAAEIARPGWLELSEEKADIQGKVTRLLGTAVGLLVGCSSSVSLVGMFYWHRARVLRKLTKPPNNDAAP